MAVRVPMDGDTGKRIWVHYRYWAEKADEEPYIVAAYPDFCTVQPLMSDEWKLDEKYPGRFTRTTIAHTGYKTIHPDGQVEIVEPYSGPFVEVLEEVFILDGSGDSLEWS